MRHLITLSLALLPFLINAQVYKAESSTIHFFSEAPLENIEATNKKASGAISTTSNKLAIKIPIISFKFDKALMEEHFNENYMESDKFKYATFSGTFDGDIDWSKDGEYKTSAKGKLNIHGVEQERTIPGTLVIKDGKIHLKTKFQVKLEDHDIEIPKAVFQNIAEVIDVDMEMTLAPKQ